MNERENLIAQVTEKATKEAKKQKLNEAQTKLYIETEVQKAVAEYDSKNTTVAPTTAISNTAEVNTSEKAEIKTNETKAETKNENKEKRYIVHTPVLNYCGEVAGVQFAYGKAEVKEGWILNWFKEHGYRVEEVSE